ncbi:MAG: RpiB/LacA/LacB family sugar-phosphate isomerase [Thermoleophilia bacterium]|nr:RpiB/LacA/LacB family sugar-phosphate isomerase [Thermoleophilia bacterium]
MIVAIGADHGGYLLKTSVVAALQAEGHEVLDLGAFDAKPSDYPDFSLGVATAVRGGLAERGIVVCGSGVGACVAANKVPGIRAGTAHDTFSAHQGVEDDDMNVLCLGARVVGRELALELVHTFLGARFSGAERHRRRLAKVHDIEKTYSSNEV